MKSSHLFEDRGTESISESSVKDLSNDMTCRAGQYLNTLYLNTVFKYIYCI